MSDFLNSIIARVREANAWADEKHKQFVEEDQKFRRANLPDTALQPGDEDKPASNLANLIVQKINSAAGTQIPMQTIAQEKQALYELPSQMGQSAGAIMKVGGTAKQIAEQVALKLENAVAKGYKPTAAEAEAVAKFRGQTAVLPTRQEAAALRDQLAARKPDVRDVVDQFNRPASTLSIQNGKPVQLLPKTKGSGI